METLYKEKKINKETLEKITSILGFCIEFLMSVILIYSIYKITIYKENQNIWNLKYILISIIPFVIVIANIIWNCKKGIFEKIIISFLIPVGMMYAFFLAPSYVPDEHAHIWKALEISQGKLITNIDENGDSLESIPAFFEDNRIPNIKRYGQFNDAIREKTDYNDLVEVENPAKAYAPIIYIASAFAFWIAKVIGLNGIMAIYLARLFNFIIFLIFSYLAIKLIPAGKWIIATILFFPITLQQAASISADSILNSLSLFYVCYTLYICKKADKISIWQKIMYIAIGIIIAISKIVYIPLVGISLLLIGNKKISKKEKGIFITISIVSAILFGIFWFLFMQKYAGSGDNTYNELNQVDLKGQIINIIKNPQILFTAIYNTIKDGLYLDSAIGNYMGWLNIETAHIVIYTFIMLFILSPFLEKGEVEYSKWEKIWGVLIYVGTYLLIIFAAYLSWTTVGKDTVMGVQGRYFIPVIALPMLCLCSKERYLKFNNIKLIMPVIYLVLNVITIIDIAKFFL